MLEGAKNYDNPCLDAVLLASSNAVDTGPSSALTAPVSSRAKLAHQRRMRWCVRCFWTVLVILLALRFVWG